MTSNSLNESNEELQKIENNYNNNVRSNNIPSASAKSAREAIDYQRSNIRQKEEFLGSDQNILKSIIYHVNNIFQKEIQDEIKLEEKYKLNHTEEELKYRKELQSKYRAVNASERRKFLNAFWTSFKWIRRYYLSFSSKNSFEEYEYSKHVLWRYSRLVLYGCLYGSGYTFLMFLWMRLLKHKGRKDKYYLLGMNFFMSLTIISNFTYNTLYNTRLPLSSKDLDNRKELMEEFVFGSNKSFVLTQEIKKISKYYFKEKVEHIYITPHSGQKVSFIVTEGRLYLSCVDYAEVFGYNIGNIKAKIENLNYYNLKDRDVILGLFELYDLLIDKYKEKFNIKDSVKTINTEILEEIIKNKNLTEENLNYLKKSRILQDVEYSKIAIQKSTEENERLEDSNNISEANESIDKNKSNDKDNPIKSEEKKKPKFYF